MRACGKRAKGTLDGTSVQSTETSSGAQKRSAEHPKRRTCTRMQNNCQTLTQTERPRPTCSQATRAASKRRHPNKETSSGALTDVEGCDTPQRVRVNMKQCHAQTQTKRPRPTCSQRRAHRANEGTQKTKKLLRAQRNAQSAQSAARARVFETYPKTDKRPRPRRRQRRARRANEGSQGTQQTKKLLRAHKRGKQ